jgi:hypothetical protein
MYIADLVLQLLAQEGWRDRYTPAAQQGHENYRVSLTLFSKVRAATWVKASPIGVSARSWSSGIGQYAMRLIDRVFTNSYRNLPAEFSTSR